MITEKRMITIKRIEGFRLCDFMVSNAGGVQFAPSAWLRLFGRERPSLTEINYHEIELPMWRDVNVHVMTLRSLTAPAEAISLVGNSVSGCHHLKAAEIYLHPWIICSVLWEIMRSGEKLRPQYFFYGRDINMVPALAHIVALRAELWTVSVYDQYALSPPAKSGLFVPRLCLV